VSNQPRDNSKPRSLIDERLSDLTQRCRELHVDIKFDAVRHWKAEQPDRIAVGYLPMYIPAEIVHATGALPVGIIGGGDRVDVIKGDAYFQSYICHLPRSFVDLGLSGHLDELDAMLFPAICDVIRNLSGVWQMLFPDKMVRFVDFPQNFSPEIGGRFYRQQLAGLANDIASLTGTSATPDRLRTAIALYNENRSLIRELHTLRSKSPDQVSTTDAYVVQRAGHVLPVEEHNALLREFLDLSRQRPRQPRDNARIVIVGAFCEQPPLALLRSLELAGCDIVDDDMLLGNRLLTADVGETGDPFEALSDAYLGKTLPCSSVYDDNGQRCRGLVERVRQHDADGVVFAAPSFCDPALLDRPAYQKALEAASIPFTAFKYAENTGQLGAIREQVGTFAESIRLWSDSDAEVAARS
jgi:benzoyl-CoA reductase subunit C